MKFDVKGIINGAWNSIVVKDWIEKVAEERLAICNVCPENSDMAKTFKNYKTFRPDFHCTLCGCNLHMKTRSMSQECPIKKWGAHMTEQEEIDMNKQVENESTD